MSLAKGTQLAKKLSRFLRHEMRSVQFCKYTGSVDLMEVERSTKIKAEMIQFAVNPAFDKDHKGRFMVIEKIFPDGQKIERVAALGGHSK